MPRILLREVRETRQLSGEGGRAVRLDADLITPSGGERKKGRMQWTHPRLLWSLRKVWKSSQSSSQSQLSLLEENIGLNLMALDLAMDS